MRKQFSNLMTNAGTTLFGVIAELSRKADHHQANGQFGEALRAWDHVIALAPGEGQAFCNRGAVLAGLGRFEEALRNFDRAVALKPNNAEFHYNRGFVLAALSRAEEAIKCYEIAARLQPEFFDAYFRLGQSLYGFGHYEAAFHNFEKAVILQPRRADAHNALGAALGELGHHDVALQSYDRAIACDANFADAWYNRGNTLIALSRRPEALSSYERALQLRPDHVAAHTNRGDLLHTLMRFEEAVACYERALAIAPGLALAHSNRANALKELGRPEAAMRGYDRAIALDPNFADAHLNKGLHKLLQGEFAEGWQLYEWRKKRQATARAHTQPIWQGQNLAGKTILIEAEQGLGDTLQFCRYGVVLATQGVKVILAAQPGLVRLLKQMHPGIAVVSAVEPPPAFDYHIMAPSLPLVMGTRLENIPAAVPYLHSEPERAILWKRRLGDQGFKIGIAWQGDPRSQAELGRSFPVRHYEALSKLSNVRLISLQKHTGEGQLQDLPSGMVVESLGVQFDAGPDAFLDTAAVMSSLDLVITSDTSIAHLAGALGRPVWVALKHVPDWRWLLDRSDSPWYPTMRLFRQTAPGDWIAVHAQIEKRLAGLLRAGPAQTRI